MSRAGSARHDERLHIEMAHNIVNGSGWNPHYNRKEWALFWP